MSALTPKQQQIMDMWTAARRVREIAVTVGCPEHEVRGVVCTYTPSLAEQRRRSDERAASSQHAHACALREGCAR